MSLQARLLRPLARHLLRPILRRADDPAIARGRFELAARLFFRPPPGTIMRTDRLAGCRALVVENSPRAPGLILYFHGGAYILGSPETHAAMMAVVARDAGVQVILPDYRLAPEHPFPAAFEDACAVWAALMARGLAPCQIVLGGDSAGGGLALALLAHLCAIDQRPAGAFAFSPWTDLTGSALSVGTNAGLDQYLPVERLDEVRALVMAGADPADVRISPLHACFVDPPPVQIHCAGTEILRDDALRLTGPLPQARLAQAGDLPHAWPILHNWLPEARATLAETARFVTDCLRISPVRQN